MALVGCCSREEDEEEEAPSSSSLLLLLLPSDGTAPAFVLVPWNAAATAALAPSHAGP